MWDLTVWTYKHQKAHLDGGRVGAIGYSAISQTAAVLERVRLGTASGGHCGLNRTYADDDALAVHELVLRMTANERALIVGHGKQGDPPDWSPTIPPVKVVPVLRGNGKPKMLYPPRRHEPIACLIAYQGVLPQQAAALRERAKSLYLSWYQAMTILADALISLDELIRWKVTEVGVMREPWQRM
jgi:hypothetical protein